MYEIMWRHFSVWGEIEDINLVPNKGIAFIRYAHRCMAEFAKEAMVDFILFIIKSLFIILILNTKK